MARISYVETIRGIACILLVSYHVVGASQGQGLGLTDENPLRVFGALLSESRMPLFSFISGLVFGAIVLSASQWNGKIRSKARRLLVPLIVVGTLHYLFKGATVGFQRPYYEIFFLPQDHYWFLQATFLIMFAHLTLSFLLRGASDRAALALLVISLLVYVFFDRWAPNVFSSASAIYLAPFFFTGHLVAVWGEKFVAGQTGGPVSRPLFIGAFIVLLTVNFAFITGTLSVPSIPFRAFQIALGLATCFALMSLRPDWKPLATIGGYSYAIFLFHVFFTGGSRIILHRLLPQVDMVWFYLPGLIAGIAGPILLSQLILRSSLASLLLLGVKRRPAQVRPSASPNPSPVNP